MDRKALIEIFNNLQRGKKYGHKVNNVTYPYFSTVLCLSPDKVFIRWQHFGSSSNRNTIKELSWIIDKIFKTTPSGFIKLYQIQ